MEMKKLNDRFPDNPVTPRDIRELFPGEIFVFGSNTAGIHAGGAALTALLWGAKEEVAEGVSGDTYAIPTLDGWGRRLPYESLKKSFEDFLRFASSEEGSAYLFLLTPVGLGIAAWTLEDVRTVLKAFLDAAMNVGGVPTNVTVPLPYRKFCSSCRFSSSSLSNKCDKKTLVCNNPDSMFFLSEVEVNDVCCLIELEK